MVDFLRGPLPHPGQTGMSAPRNAPERAGLSQPGAALRKETSGLADAPEPLNPVALDFEKQVVTTMVEDMLKTSKVETFGGGHAEEMWRSFLARGIADSIVDSGGIGLAGSVNAAITAYQGKR